MGETIVLIAVLVLAGMLLIVAEICTPMFGLLGLVALGCVGWSVYLCYTINGVFGLVMTIAVVVGLPIYIVTAVKVLPKSPLGRRLHLGRNQAQPGEGTPEASELAELVGRRCNTETTLRPSGMVRIDNKRIVAQAESGMIEKGVEVEVIRATGMGVVVRKVQSEQHA